MDTFNLGRHEGLIEQLVNGQRDIYERLGTIESTLAERRGERRVATGLWGMFGGAIVATLIALFKGVIRLPA